MSYSDIMDENQLLDHIRCNLIDVESEQQKTNQLLGQILEELRKFNQFSITVSPLTFSTAPASGYTCWKCGGWITSPAPHICNPIIT